MSGIDDMFEALRQALQSLWPEDGSGQVAVHAVNRMLLLQLPNDVAAFSVLDGHPDEDFKASYGEFKRMYRENHQAWDDLTLSFVACRSSENAENDRFYASLEHDPLFCRKYVIRAYDDVNDQRTELLRLPFLPLQTQADDRLQRPQSAQDLLQSAGLSSSLARKIVEQGQRSADGISAQEADRVRRFVAEGERIDGVDVRVEELTGAPGDVILMHPWTFHAPATNCSRRPRMMVSHSVSRKAAIRL
jgi:hypothetical protein